MWILDGDKGIEKGSVFEWIWANGRRLRGGTKGLKEGRWGE
jgi:hypothetical protein